MKYVGDKSQIKSRMVRNDGLIQKITLESGTDVIARSGKKSAEYVGRIWYHNVGNLTVSNQIEFSHSW